MPLLVDLLIKNAEGVKKELARLKAKLKKDEKKGNATTIKL